MATKAKPKPSTFDEAFKKIAVSRADGLKPGLRSGPKAGRRSAAERGKRLPKTWIAA
jgi:hypothetical protein